MKQAAYYEAFAYNQQTHDHDVWVGTATLAAISKAGLKADLSYPLYGDEKLAIKGWACRSVNFRSAYDSGQVIG